MTVTRPDIKELTVCVFDADNINWHCTVANVHRNSAKKINTVTRYCLVHDHLGIARLKSKFVN